MTELRTRPHPDSPENEMCEHKELIKAILEREDLLKCDNVDPTTGKWYCPECKLMVQVSNNA